MAQVMVARGYVKTVREAFDKYLGSGKPGHVPRKKVTPEDAVRIIRKAGGVPGLDNESGFRSRVGSRSAPSDHALHSGRRTNGKHDFVPYSAAIASQRQPGGVQQSPACDRA